MRAFLLITIASTAIGCSRVQPAPTPVGASQPIGAPSKDAATAKNEAAKSEGQSKAVQPLSQAAQNELLDARVEADMGGTFGQFANVFLVFSRIQLGSGVGLMTPSKEVSSAELMPVFPSSYKPTLRELMDAIALQTFSQWRYDPSGKYFQSDVEGEAPPNDLAIFEFIPTKRDKPFAVTLADGWKPVDKGHWLMLVPPAFPVGMDIYEMGTYSSSDKATEKEFLQRIRADVAVEWAQRVKEDVAQEDMKQAKVGAFDALHFEAMVPSQLGKEIRWRQWVFMDGNKCFFIVSTILPEHESEIFPAVENMLQSFEVKEAPKR